MLVHRCDRCCVYKKEIQPCRTKYRGIWAILMHKIMFPSESCNSVSKGTFCEFRPFPVIAENHWPYKRNNNGVSILYVITQVDWFYSIRVSFEFLFCARMMVKVHRQ